MIAAANYSTGRQVFFCNDWPDAIRQARKRARNSCTLGTLFACEETEAEFVNLDTIKLEDLPASFRFKVF